MHAAPGRTPGPYALQAAIAACHARARSAEETDWAQIVGLYAKLGEVTPSPVVELNRAVALAMLFGPEAGLNVVDALTAEPALKTYHLLPSVRGDLLRKLGRFDDARAEFERAAGLTRNERERRLLLDRAAACAVVSDDQKKSQREFLTNRCGSDLSVERESRKTPNALRQPSIHNYLESNSVRNRARVGADTRPVI